MKKEIELYGTIHHVEKYYFRKNDAYTFVMHTDEGAYMVHVNESEAHWDLDNNRHYYVRGYEVSEGVVVAEYVDRWGRYCDHCKKWHIEGYYVGEYYYACSDECAIAICGSEQEFRDSIVLDEDGELAEDSPTYWTEWE